MQNEKRYFQRVGINLSGQLTANNGAISNVDVLDMSLQGVRVIIPAATFSDTLSAPVRLSLKVNEDSPAITLTGIVTHQHAVTESPEQVEAGIRITHIPVDDLGVLRRLLLLNSGQDDMDTAELEALVDKITKALS